MTILIFSSSVVVPSQLWVHDLSDQYFSGSPLTPRLRVQIEATMEGENVMTMTRMELNEPPAMAPSINVTCKITPDTPLWGKTYHDLKAEGAAIYVALAATDNQHFQEVFARRFYLVQVPAPPRLYCFTVEKAQWAKISRTQNRLGT